LPVTPPKSGAEAVAFSAASLREALCGFGGRKWVARIEQGWNAGLSAGIRCGLR
jgi:hypothetical protein